MKCEFDMLIGDVKFRQTQKWGLSVSTQRHHSQSIFLKVS